MNVANHSVVSIHYTLTDPQGTIIDSSEGEAPLTYMQGTGHLIPGLEKEILGKAVGDEFEVTVSPAEGYGERDDGMMQEVPLAAFEGIEQVEPGMQFQTADQEGNTQLITVAEVNGDRVTIDGNHPLAGVELNFKVEITAIRDATEAELASGQVE